MNFISSKRQHNTRYKAKNSNTKYTSDTKSYTKLYKKSKLIIGFNKRNITLTSNDGNNTLKERTSKLKINVSNKTYLFIS